MTPQTCCLCAIRTRDDDIVTALKSSRWHTAETDWWHLLLLSLSRKSKNWRAKAKRTGLSPAIRRSILTPDPVTPPTPPSASVLSLFFFCLLASPLFLPADVRHLHRAIDALACRNHWGSPCSAFSSRWLAGIRRFVARDLLWRAKCSGSDHQLARSKLM